MRTIKERNREKGLWGKIRTGCIALLFLLALSMGAPADMGYFSAVQTVQAAVGGVKIDGTVYVFNKKGKLVKRNPSEIVKVEKYYYYVDQEGKAATGLFQIGEKWYYGGKKRGRLWKENWKTVNGSQYYFKENFSAATGGTKIDGKVYVFSSDGKLIKKKKSSVVEVGKQSYYVDKNGIAKTGWFLVGKKLYYADSKGRLKKNKTVDGIQINSKGYAKSGDMTSAKIRIMKIYSSITTSSMTKSQKLRACWNYVCGGRFRYSTLYYPNLEKANWVYLCAENTFSRSAGNCYGFACAFGVLAREAGYKVEMVAGKVVGSRDHSADGYTRHCWVRIDGLYYDPEAQYAGWYRGIYGLRSYPVNPHKIVQIKTLY